MSKKSIKQWMRILPGDWASLTGDPRRLMVDVLRTAAPHLDDMTDAQLMGAYNELITRDLIAVWFRWRKGAIETRVEVNPIVHDVIWNGGAVH